MYNGTEGFVNRTDIDERIVEMAVMHSINLDCLWSIEVDPSSKVSVKNLYVSFGIDLLVILY